eukprot:TRINITY_DN4114_c0_g1_i1.p1 TRINITY_DN4114_c0_g1~~TRINITY_DN4114_c0_g1_i1.p1  ORF type:complete len:1174 (+),score=400.37 TRINITY_DN4114_c0_g1_i1:70-3591(+)
MMGAWAACLLGAAAAGAPKKEYHHRVLWGCPMCEPEKIAAGERSDFIERQWEELVRLSEEGVVTVFARAVEDAAQLQAAIAATGATYVITSTEMTGAVGPAAVAHPDVYFTIIDAEALPSGDLANVQGVQFREDQAGYLAGTLAGMHSQSGKVACLAGVGFAPLRRFRNGFQAGVRRTCPACEVHGVFASSFADAAQGERLAAMLVGRGADVVFAAAGRTGSGGIRHVADPTYVIGVDFDEYYTTFAEEHGPGGKAAHLLGSAMKMTDAAVVTSVRQAVEGRFIKGWKSLDIAVDAVALSPCHEACAAITPKTQLSVDQALADLKAGNVSTGVAPGTGAYVMPLPGFGAVNLTDHYGPKAQLQEPVLVGDGLAGHSGKYLILDAAATHWNASMWYAPVVHALDSHPTVSASAPRPRKGFAAAGAGGQVFIMGGHAGAYVFDDLWRWGGGPCMVPGACGVDPVWEQLATPPGSPAPPARHSHTLTAARGGAERLLMFGGATAAGQLLRDLWAFDPASAAWAALPAENAPSGRQGHAAVWWVPDAEDATVAGVTDTNFLFVFGGRHADALGDLHVFGVASENWAAVDPVGQRPPARSAACVAAVGAHLVVVGGVGDAGMLRDAWVYSIVHNVWTELPLAHLGGASGRLTCYAEEGTPVDVVDAGLPAYADSPHRIYMAAPGNTREGALRIVAFPALRCNATAGLVLEASGTQCAACPEGTLATDGACRACTLLSEEERTATERARVVCPPPVVNARITAVALGASAGVLVVVAAALAWWRSGTYRKMRKLRDTNKMATELAVAVAQMDFQAVAYLESIDRPTKIQLAFIEIVQSLQMMKAYIPRSLFVEPDDLRCDDSSHSSPAHSDDDSNYSGSAASSTGGGLRGAVMLAVQPSGSAPPRGAAVRCVASTALTLVFKRMSYVSVNVRNFIALTADMRDGEVLALHSELVTVAALVFHDHCGVPDFTGDKFTASFNVLKICSLHGTSACMAAVAIRDALKAKQPTLRITAGCASGKARAGNSGSRDMRKFTFYTAVVPWAAALERVAKVLDCAVLADEEACTPARMVVYSKVVAAVLYPKFSETPRVVVELQEPSTLCQQRQVESEWMYELDELSRCDPYRDWNIFARAVMHGRWDTAHECRRGAADLNGNASRFRTFETALNVCSYTPLELAYL